jgi:hypothetical protein
MATMKRRHTPLSEKQQQDYATLVGQDEYNDTDSLLKEKSYKYNQPPPQQPIIYSSNEVRGLERSRD